MSVSVFLKFFTNRIFSFMLGPVFGFLSDLLIWTKYSSLLRLWAPTLLVVACLGELMVAERIVCCLGRLPLDFVGLEPEPDGATAFLRLVEGLLLNSSGAGPYTDYEIPPLSIGVSEIDF